jgi:hypothetical protein
MHAIYYRIFIHNPKLSNRGRRMNPKCFKEIGSPAWKVRLPRLARFMAQKPFTVVNGFRIGLAVPMRRNEGGLENQGGRGPTRFRGGLG